jgi:hypothetical protein
VKSLKLPPRPSATPPETGGVLSFQQLPSLVKEGQGWFVCGNGPFIIHFSPFTVQSGVFTETIGKMAVPGQQVQLLNLLTINFYALSS